MKIMSINNSYQHNNQKQTSFKKNFLHKAKLGLLPLALSGGLLIAQPTKAADTSNFYPENEFSVPSGETPIKFLKGMIAGAIALYGLVWGINAISSKKDEDNK